MSNNGTGAYQAPQQSARYWRVVPIYAAAALFCMTAAAAAGWSGASLQWQYYAFKKPYDGGGSPTTCTVGNNDCGAFFSYFKVVPRANSITFDFSPSGAGSTWSPSALSLDPTIHNGIAINLLSAGTISAVRIDPSTNMARFNTTRISFTAKQIQVDWRTLHFDSSTIVRLNVKVEPPRARGGSLTTNPPSVPDSR